MGALAPAVAGCLAVHASAAGRPRTGLVLVLLLHLIGSLDGVEAKLARGKVALSRWRELEHALDKLPQSAWFLAFGGWPAGAGMVAWLAAGGIVASAPAEVTDGEFFGRLTGRQLEGRGPFERPRRRVAGQRGTFFRSLLPLAAFGHWFEGLSTGAVRRARLGVGNCASARARGLAHGGNGQANKAGGLRD